MKTKLRLILGGLFLFSQAAMAQPTITLQAQLPLATGLTLTVNTIPAATQVFPTSGAVTNPSTINFGTLAYNLLPLAPGVTTEPNTWQSASYFAIDITASGGTGVPLVNITYAEGSNPNAGTAAASLGGLGTKTTIAFDSVTTAAGSDKPTGLPQQRLIDLVTGGTLGEVPVADIPLGGWERVYVGLWNGASGNPSNGKAFTSSDTPGTYTGVLTFTAVTL